MGAFGAVVLPFSERLVSISYLNDQSIRLSCIVGNEPCIANNIEVSKEKRCAMRVLASHGPCLENGAIFAPSQKQNKQAVGVARKWAGLESARSGVR